MVTLLAMILMKKLYVKYMSGLYVFGNIYHYERDIAVMAVLAVVIELGRHYSGFARVFVFCISYIIIYMSYLS